MAIDGNIGIGHLRLATHGFVSKDNTHPQFDCGKTVAIVHNGIIENHTVLKKQLEDAGHTFGSSTDSEVIAHLLEVSLLSHKTCKAALIDLLKHIEGAYSFVAMLQEHPDTMIVVRKRSPMYVGIGDDELMVASSMCAFEDFSNKIAIMPDESFALIQKNFIEVYDFEGKPLPIHAQEVSLKSYSSQKCGYDHYMLKEIYEQKSAVHSTLEFLKVISPTIWDYLSLSADEVKNIECIHLVGAGTSWHSARIAQFFFEQIVKIPTQTSLSSEFLFMPMYSKEHTAHIMLSQSGETADTLEALRLINNTDQTTIAVTNEPSSSMVRETSGFLLTQAGREQAAASTKSFSTQLVVLYWFALAKQYAQYKNMIFLGRHITYPFAMEAALKLKKISYIFAESYPAGELKHGPLALIDPTRPVFIFSHPDNKIYQKLLSNAQEIKARGGHIVAFVFEGQNELQALADTVFVIPTVKPLLAPIAMAGLMQFFIYHIAKHLDCPIDKPRTIGKTVTIE